MKTLPKVRFVVAWGQYRKGDIIQPTGVFRDELLRGRLVELVQEQPATVPVIETAEAPALETAVRHTRRRGTH